MRKKALFLFALSAVSAHAAPIYKCVDAQGATSFQSAPCPGKATQTEVVLGREAMPPATPEQPEPAEEAGQAEAPDQGGIATSSRLDRLRGPSPEAVPPPQTAREKVSYQCTAQDGSVFYAHNSCPSRIRAGTATSVSSGGVRGVSTDGNYLQVTQKTVSREAACREMRKPGASDRKGYEYDQKTATYDKQAGRDPCG